MRRKKRHPIICQEDLRPRARRGSTVHRDEKRESFIGRVANGRAALSLRPDGLLLLHWRGDLEIHLEDALSALESIQAVSAGVEYPLVVNITGLGQVSSAAFGTPHQRKVALLGASPVDRTIANYFIGQPQNPTRFFVSESEAVQWSKEC